VAKVKTFRINPAHGVPDKDIRAWIDLCEQEIGYVTVSSVFIPSVGAADPRLTVIVTKLDDPDQGIEVAKAQVHPVTVAESSKTPVKGLGGRSKGSHSSRL
jgi:hypothetical protein